jgi:hypothetical protein
MPSSKGYIRDIKQEERTAKARGEQSTGHNSGEAKRMRARRLAIKQGMIEPGSKKDVNHIDPVVKGGSNAASNLNVETQHKNRSFKRTKGAGMA